MEFETILYEKQDTVATITLNRPERHNAFNLTMARDLQRVWGGVQKDPEVVCAILTGAGERAFCTGMDVADVAAGGQTTATKGLDRSESPWFQLTAL